MFNISNCRGGIALKHVYSIPLVQHLVCGTSMQEIYEQRAIYQQGAPRKVNSKYFPCHNYTVFLLITYLVHLASCFCWKAKYHS